MPDENGGPSTKTDGNGGLSTTTDANDPHENALMKITTEEATATHIQLHKELVEINEKIYGKGKIEGCMNATDMMAESRNSRTLLAQTVL